MASNMLAQAVVSGESKLIDIPSYYTYRKNKYGTLKIVILKDDVAKKMMEDEKKKELVEVLNTKWKEPNWIEQNEIIEQSQDVNPMNNQKEPNWTRYRDLRIKRLMIDWDMVLDGKKIPVTEEYINRLPAEIVLDLFDKFERASNIDQEEQGK